MPRKYEVRKLMTGMFKVKDVKCKQCLTTIGWKYLEASAPSQKYKENHFVIEAILIKKLKAGESLLSYLSTKSPGFINTTNDNSSYSKELKFDPDKMKEFTMQLNRNNIYLTNDQQYNDNFSDDDEGEEEGMNINDFSSLDDVDKVIYKDNSHYFEMKKDLLNHFGFSKHFHYYFSSHDNGIDENNPLLCYNDNYGYYYEGEDVNFEDGNEEVDDAELQNSSYSEDENEDQIEEASDSSPTAGFRIDPQSYYLLQHSNRRSYIPQFRSLLRAGNALFNSGNDPMALENITNDFDSNRSVQVRFSTNANSDNPAAANSNVPSNMHSRNPL